MTMQFDDGAHINDVALAVKGVVHATLLPDGGKLGNKELCRIVTMVLARLMVENPDVVCSPTSMSRAHDAAARTLRGAITDMKTLGKLHPVAPSIREHIPGELSPARQLQEISRETPAPTQDAP